MWNVHQTVWKNVSLHTKSLIKKRMGCRFHPVYVCLLHFLNKHQVQGKIHFKCSLECLKKVRKINHIFHLFMIFLDSDKLRSVATLFIDDLLKIFFSNLLRTVSCIALILVKLDSLDFLPFPFLSGIFRLIPVAASISRSNSGSCQPLSSA